jgi:hypothetical protein
MKAIPYTIMLTGLILISTMACTPKKTTEAGDPEIQKKVDAYALFTLTTDLNSLGENEKQMIPILIEAAGIMDDIFWSETYGNKGRLFDSISDPATARFAEINYGPWERLNEDRPFVKGVGPKPAGAQFYPVDMTKEEFDAMEAADKTSLYTMVRREKTGNLYTIPYHIFFNDQVTRAAGLIRRAAALAEDPGLRKYLELRAEALLTDDYYPSDVAWMEMKNNRIDFVCGPIENYEDALFGYKAAHEAFVLVKDPEWSLKLARFSQLLPDLQKSLPVADEYKQEVPGIDSDLGVYDALFYAGDCNAGSKTIAINLPNDERVQLEKGSRKLQLKNSIKAKFDKILLPISEHIVAPDQRKHIVFDAFFENIMFHEVSHGLGIKNTLNGSGPVRKVLSEQYSALEEAKADILGLYLVSKLAEMGELGEKDLMDNYVTFMAGIFRSVRFGASNAHGKGNMLQFNYFLDAGAFVRDNATGFYQVDFEKMKEAVAGLGQLILTLQGDGNYEGAKQLMAEKGIVPSQLQEELNKINGLGIPKDIVFEQGLKVLGY